MKTADLFPKRSGTGQPSRRLSSLLDVLGLDDTNMSEPTVSLQPADNSTDLWLKEFNQYLDTADQIPEGQTLIEWWAVSLHFDFKTLQYS